MAKMGRWWGLGALALLAAGVAVQAAPRFFEEEPPEWRTSPVERQEITSAVVAAGRVEAVTTVIVGSELSGRIAELYADYNTPVVKGQLIARLDTDAVDAKLASGEADLEAEQALLSVEKAQMDRVAAGIESVRASLDGAAAELAGAEKTYKRQQELRRSGVAAAAAYEQAETELAMAQARKATAAADLAAAEAELRVAQAKVLSSQASVRQKEAALRQTEVDLERSQIRAPVDGVVVERSINVGQTVAASFQAPALFSIAQDLTQMQVLATVDEADIGGMESGQPATFSVSAYPYRKFEGRVLQVRLAPSIVQNVVTYTVVISADNRDRRLMPGMTADVQIIREKKADALAVPNAALRFRPPSQGDAGFGSSNRVFVTGADGQAVVVPVEAGISDDEHTEILSGLEEGQAVIVGIRNTAASGSSGSGLRLGF